LEEASEDVSKLIGEYCEDFKHNTGFIKGLAEEIEGVWEVNPEADEVQAIFVADATGNVTFEYVGCIDYWSGVSHSNYPYRSHVPVPSKPDSSDGEIEMENV
jgi:hypothetical protein